MRICAFFRGSLFGDKIVLVPTDEKDKYLVKKLFDSKTSREKRIGKEILLECEIDAAFQKRTFKQLRAVWKLVEVIFMNDSENNRKPTSEERYNLYLDLLELYADKIPSRFGNTLRPVHLSEGNTVEVARFIDNLLYHISTQCSLPTDLQATVRSVLYKWQIWRGTLDTDINEYRTIEEMREKIRYSEASGRCENIEFAHIVSRGADAEDIDETWNLLALTHDEHIQVQHAKGWEVFLEKYPHLKGRVEKAREKASKLPLSMKQTVKDMADSISF